MHRWLLVFSIPILLLISGCKPEARRLLPVTGDRNSAPRQVEQARDQVLAYVLASSRLASLPRDADWQLETSGRAEDEYAFRSGDWLIVIRLPASGDGHQRVMILNNTEQAAWIGYITTDGQVVDTAYAR